MRLRASDANAQLDYRSGDILLTLRVGSEYRAAIDEVLCIGNELSVDIKRYRASRSLDANAYLWVLIDKIAYKIGSTKELIYREIIKRCGVFDVIAVRSDAAESVIRGWSDRGIGWVAEEIDGCKLDGAKRIALYYGSSVYDTAEFSRLLNEVIADAKELGIDTATPDEIALMMARLDDEKQANKGT